MDVLMVHPKGKTGAGEVSGETELDAMKALMKGAFEEFNTQSLLLTRAYNDLKEEVARINLELEAKNRELSEKNRALDQAGVFLNNLIEGMQSGIMVVDQENRVVKSNAALSRLLGFPGDNLVGQKVSDCDSLKPFLQFIQASRKSRAGSPS